MGFTIELSKRTSNILNYRSDFNHNLLEIDRELVRVLVTLDSLEKKVNRSFRQSLVEAKRTIRNYILSNKDKDGLFGVYLTLVRVVSEIEELQKDRTWEG